MYFHKREKWPLIGIICSVGRTQARAGVLIGITIRAHPSKRFFNLLRFDKVINPFCFTNSQVQTNYLYMYIHTEKEKKVTKEFWKCKFVLYSNE